MNSHTFRTSVKNAILLLIELRLGQDPRHWGSLSPSDMFKQAAFDLGTPYGDLYQIGLREKDYNILLTDFSFLQFYGVGDEQEFRVRYAYYPNPYFVPSLDDVEPDEDGPEDIEFYMQLATESPEVNRRAIIRYEVARSDYQHLRHPAAHIHLGLDPRARLPVDKELTPLAFAFLIARYFYPETWNQFADEFQPTDNLTGLESRYVESRLDCDTLGEELFSAHERRQFHFS